MYNISSFPSALFITLYRVRRITLKNISISSFLIYVEVSHIVQWKVYKYLKKKSPLIDYYKSN